MKLRPRETNALGEMALVGIYALFAALVYTGHVASDGYSLGATGAFFATLLAGGATCYFAMEGHRWALWLLHIVGGIGVLILIYYLPVVFVGPAHR